MNNKSNTATAKRYFDLFKHNFNSLKKYLAIYRDDTLVLRVLFDGVRLFNILALKLGMDPIEQIEIQSILASASISSSASTSASISSFS